MTDQIKPEKAQPDEIDQFGSHVANNLRELIEIGTPAGEWADYLQSAIEALLMCHHCGTPGLPSDPCCGEDEPSGNLTSPAKPSGGDTR